MFQVPQQILIFILLIYAHLNKMDKNKIKMNQINLWKNKQKII